MSKTTKRILLISLAVFLLLSSIAVILYFTVFRLTFNKKVNDMKEQMYFVPLNPEEATQQDWDYIDSQDWIKITSVDVTNFNYFVNQMKVIKDVDGDGVNDNGQWRFYQPITLAEIESNSDYQAEVKASILDLAAFMSTVKWLTYTEEFTDLVLNANNKYWGSSGEHYYYKPSGIYGEEKAKYYNTETDGGIAPLNPMEMVLVFRNITNTIYLSQKLVPWIYMNEYKGTPQYTMYLESFYDFDRFYFNVLGAAFNVDDSPRITIKWDNQTFNDPDGYSNSSYEKMITVRDLNFGSGSTIDDNGFKNVPNSQQRIDIFMHELAHTLGYKHITSDKYPDAIYGIDAIYDELNTYTFYSEAMQESINTEKWFYNNIDYSSEKNWEQYNFYDYMWDYNADQIGDIDLTNYYNYTDNPYISGNYDQYWNIPIASMFLMYN